MNFKKTWWGYVNFILASVLSCACIISLCYINLEYNMKDFLANTSKDPVAYKNALPFWLALIIGIVCACILSQVYVLFRKVREIFFKKKGIFDTDTISEGFGGFISFIIFATGLFLRVKAIIDKDAFSVSIKSTVNSINVQALFDKNNGLSFASFNDFYDSIVAFVYKFSGIKDSVYMWVNFSLHVVLILLVFLAIMKLYNATVAIIPMLYLCLYPENIKLVANGGYENVERILIALVFLLSVLFISLFRRNKYYDILSLILSFIAEILVLIVLPMGIHKEFNALPEFKFEISQRLYDFVLFEKWDFFAIGIFLLIFAASLSFYFCDRDKITTIFPLWVAAMLFFIFSNAAWCTPFYAAIITAVFAGIGVDELLTSRITLKEKKETIQNPKREIKEVIVKKPVQSGITAAHTETKNDKLQVETVSERIISDNEVSNTSPDISPSLSGESGKVELFESPLPLPKKHVKKEIDYKFEPSSDRMKFDIDVSEGDDFDI